MRKGLPFLLLLFIAGRIQAQSVSVSFSVDTSDMRIQSAIHFLESYVEHFAKKDSPDYSYYWSQQDRKRSSLPDDMVFAISSDGPTYTFGYKHRLTVFFARVEGGVVHLKSLLATPDSTGNCTVWAIMNHYVIADKDHPRFISELSLHKDKYKSVKNGNITYHLPASDSFDKGTSDQMLQRLNKIVHDWGFKSIDINYYYAPDDVTLANMRGFDYVFGIGEPTPSGISLYKQQTIFCQGLGEGYLHEILHVYFNPQYESSPMCHPLVYYLAGGLGKDFDWMIHRLNEYLDKYPETDLNQFETIISKDPMLHIDNVSKGLLCKMLDEKEGVTGLKRALGYKTCGDLLQTEFGVSPEATGAFLRAAIKRYDKQQPLNSGGKI